eukprot:CAMPEP_0182841012 /NCGR_PEP_ID=MMETSP0006_2-20121128/24792_1 /TAXON_ID=97485 /ORGANISM="Prymnesium parvum, Strain Texoma1" /LENGTH=64 /DNA_ID=CAMNT_0024970439 /DNA_START=161 /DNA_END=352 /DNA_ORIENTATION=+
MSVAASSAFLEHSRRQVGRKKEKDLLWRDFVDKIAVLTTGETLPMCGPRLDGHRRHGKGTRRQI